MQVRPEQLSTHLARGLAPVYVVSGEEPLQVEESLDRIRTAARTRGFDERLVLDVEPGFDWSALGRSRDALSLFAERRLIDLRMPGGKPGDGGAAALAGYCKGPGDEHTVLLVSAGDLDARARRSSWYRALDAAGVAVHAWPVDSHRLPGWIAQRAEARGLHITAEAAAELAVRVEGNLLAGAQELELLGMLSEGRPIDLDAIRAVAADSARFDTFDLVDAVLGGDAGRGVRILRSLEREGTAANAVVGALAWALRALAELAPHRRGGSLEAALRGNPVWSRRRSEVERALARHPPRFWGESLAALRQVDAMAKGAEPGDPWQALVGVCAEVAGLALWPDASI